MKTINERAKEVSKINKGYTQEENFAFAGGYIFGATEQLEIDIQRAYEFCCKLCRDSYGACGYGTCCIMCDTKNELSKAMKGE